MKEVSMILSGTFFLVILFLLLKNREATTSLLGSIGNVYIAGVHQLQTGEYTPVHMGG